MSRITNQIAQNVAKQLTEAKRKQIAAVEEIINNKAYGIQLNSIPSMVLNAFSKFPSYFSSNSTMQLSGPGLNYQSVKFKHALPRTNQYLKVDEADAVEFVKLFNKKQNLEKDLQRLESDIVISLVNLRTYKNVETSFPEAFKLLPVLSASKALMIDLTSLRTQLA